MTRLSYPAGGIFLAAFVAGPIFVTSMMLAYYISMIPAAVPLSPAMLAMLPGMIITVPFGFLLAILPCLIGSALMTWASGLAIGRTRLSWVAAGSFAPFAATYRLVQTHDGGIACFALAMTGGMCALICRRYAETQPEG